ncbi:ABC transporter ATP-binding protein [Ancylothrix sp. C2]|uniref:ABC transporter ATP-binding protein n=1 Tax=Ancylothrix sp. D3o TaxID=2953691 RepID=UPI0021BA9619|nr:ABC transporter ATP-binding protein [Ancylothrix sp. D3o]MCT7949099.1 ABC transporter ATP-binding protein [Ancylothrix sp. D3o]
MTETILSVRNLQVEFQTDWKQITAVDGISFEIKRGQTLGIVGESGSGKSVTSLAVMGLVPNPPGKIVGGEIWFRGSTPGSSSMPAVNLLDLPAQKIQQYRGGQMAMIFQEPMSSLNPVYTVGFQLTEAICRHQNVSQIQAKRQAMALLQEVKLLPSDEELQQRFLETHKSWRNERQILQSINEQKEAILNRYPHQLSGGQIQRVMIAMAISCNPSLLIADEPTTALDVTVQATILSLLRDLRDRREMTMMFITHDLGVIAEIADWVAVMYQGKIVEYNSVWEIFSNPQHPYTKGLLSCRPQLNRRLRYLPTVSDYMETVKNEAGQMEILEKSIASQSQNSPTAVVASQPQLDLDGSLMAGMGEVSGPVADIVGEGGSSLPVSEGTNKLSVHSNTLSAEVSEAEMAERLQQLQKQQPLLKVDELKVGFPVRGMFGETKRYSMAVNGVSFEVYPGETLGLVGESGCGKTTLARTMIRLIEPMSGGIYFEGENITKIVGEKLRRLRREMQIIFQDPYGSLNPRMTIGEAIMEPLKIHSVGKNSQAQRERAAYLLERVGLNADWMRRLPHEFSGGQRQRVCIARALALNPKFIICDESVSALDVSVQAQVLNLLKELQGEFGLTYIFISHDLSVVKFMSDRIIVMNKGKIEEIDSSERLYREPKKDYTRQLIASIPTGSLERIKDQQGARGQLV